MQRVLFVCIENSNRSQMAEGFARLHGADVVEAYSAGSRPSGLVSPRAIAAMSAKGYDLSSHRSTGFDALPSGEFDHVVTMGCGDECPFLPAREREDWDLPDPRDLDGPAFDRVRDDIEQHVLNLLTRIRSPQ